MKDCEERLKQSQAEGRMQAVLLDKVNKDHKDARGEADDAQRGAITMFNEQKRYELIIQRLQSDVHRATTAMEKMRTEAVGLRMKIQELWNERNDRQRLFDGAESKPRSSALEERNSAIAEESGPDSNFIPTRIPCPSSHSDRSSMKPEQLRLQPECWNGGAAVGTRDGGATGPDPALSRQVETSNNAARDAQALLRATQEHQQQYLRMPQPSNLPATTGGNIGNTPFVPPLSTPSTELRTRELHGPGYYHVGSPADPGYAEQMRAMYGTSGREDIDSLRYDPP